MRCQTLRRAPGPRNLDGGWEQLLLDAARAADEEARVAEAIAPAEAGEAPAAEPEACAPREFADVWEDGVTALRAKDYLAALVAFLEAKSIRPDDPWVAVNLERLRRMGYALDSERAAGDGGD